MTDAEVVKMFEGEFEFKPGSVVPGDKSKAPYYPKAGVRLRLETRSLTNIPNGAYAKVFVTNGDWEAKLPLQQAIFRVEGNKLVAKDMDIGGGFLLKETLTMTINAKGKEMEHALEFSDGTLGKWICKS